MSCCNVSSRRAVRRAAPLLLFAWLWLPAPAAAGEALLGPGDLIEIRVWREPDLSGEHRVGVDGRVQHVLAGSVQAAGETTQSLAAALSERLERDYLREARVAVTLVSAAHRVALVVGAVTRPGSHPLPEGARVLDLLSAAGGLAPGASGEGTLLRGAAEPALAPVATGPAPAPAGAEPALPPVSAATRDAGAQAQTQASEGRRSIDLRALVEGRDLSANWPVSAGDVLFVAPRGTAGSGQAERVRVVGEVAKAGSFPLERASTLLDAVLAAGGLQEWAAANRARLVRGADTERREIPVRLGDLLAGRGEQKNLELQDGDLIVVPESFF